MNPIVIDGKGHLFGRLASVCAKELLSGRKIIIVRCEKIEISGKHIKNKFKFLSRFKKRTNTNPRHGPFHFRSPSQIFWKCLRGMISHKTKTGTRALLNIRLFEGIPISLKYYKKMKIPSALRVIKLTPGRNYTSLGQVSSEIGWTRKKIVDEIQEINRISREKKSSRKKVYLKKEEKTSDSYDKIMEKYFVKLLPFEENRFSNIIEKPQF
jgi:large subunit ribosomal protein L13Ae